MAHLSHVIPVYPQESYDVYFHLDVVRGSLHDSQGMSQGVTEFDKLLKLAAVAQGPYSVPASGAMAVANCCALAWARRLRIRWKVKTGPEPFVSKLVSAGQLGKSCLDNKELV